MQILLFLPPCMIFNYNKLSYKNAETKLSYKNIKKKNRILIFQNSFAMTILILHDNTNFTLQQLISKHLKPFFDFVTLTVNKEEIENAIMTFLNSLAVRIDNLRPQHLKDLIGKSVRKLFLFCIEHLYVPYLKKI